MKSIITLEITHKGEITNLAEKIAGRAYTISGVQDVNPVESPQIEELQRAGFSAGEIALGVSEVWRG